MPLSLIAVAMSLLPDGKVLLWSAEDRFGFDQFVGVNRPTYTAIFDPWTMTAVERPLWTNNHNMFCPGTSLLPDGSVLISGGIDSEKTSRYDPASGTFVTEAPMNVPRGYNANTTLSDGTVLTVGGSWGGGNGGKLGEVWAGAGLGWRQLPGVPGETLMGTDPDGVNKADNHMWLYGARNGWVFHAGPSIGMHWIDTKGSGNIVPVGSRADDSMSMNGVSVPYDVNKLLKVGGAPAYWNMAANRNAFVVDLGNGPPNAVTVTRTGAMNYPRAFHNGVVLPNGQVVVIGGQTTPLAFDDTGAVLRPEIWDEQSQTFTLLAPAPTPRTYHGTALLLPDGRVLAGGGGLCGDGCSANHPTLEILTPPYLLDSSGQLAARPRITSAPDRATAGSTVTVTTDSAVVSFAAVRMSSVTHSVNNDQRRVPLRFAPNGTNQWSVVLPDDRGVLLPGFYMLFALNAQGVPSIASTIRID